MPDENVLRAIPHRPPFLFIDRILEQSPEAIVIERELRPEEPHFAGHYPGHPLMPGVLLCEACFQAGAVLLVGLAGGAAPGLPMLTRILEAKFRSQVSPGEVIRAEVTLEEKMGNAWRMAARVSATRRGEAPRKAMSVEFIVALVQA